MNLPALLLLTAVGAACINQRVDALTIDQIIDALMGGSPPHWKVMFDLDSSGSINAVEWNDSIQAARDTLSIIDNTPAAVSVHPDRHRIGLVRFSSTAVTQVIFSLGTHGFFLGNDLAIAGVVKVAGATNTVLGLHLCEIEFGGSGKRLVWMTTDGKSNQGGDPVAKAKLMQKKGIVICVVAVGPDADMVEINGMASKIMIPGYRRPQLCVLEFESFQAYKTAARDARSRVVSARRNRRIN
ncbi:uncharacterized protein LOC106173190 [Lingula anatina]|uniref:Uncharacterized protein LOC106173190 n=1 Tax=Lingula anatina TaxID=7574 RepID=A0A1S3JH47_LINAN|nr:uncharacterized protein LOC106173190 [Lingula anatina]|eukprot:XP_013409683.1 uncharacterized protein LOC106173190 [Lingula anatina]